MKVTFLDCKDKNTVLIQVEDNNYLINCNSNIMSQLEERGVNNIDGIMLTKVNDEIIEGIDNVTYLNCNKRTLVLVNKKNVKEIPKKYNYENKYRVLGFHPGCMFSLMNLKVTPFELNEEIMEHKSKTAYLFSPTYSKRDTVICAEMENDYNVKTKSFFNNVEKLVFLKNDKLESAQGVMDVCFQTKPKEIYFFTNSDEKFSQEVEGIKINITSETSNFGEIKKFKDVILGYN